MIPFLTLPDPIPEEERKLTLNVYFSLFGGASKGFMKSLNPFEAPQRLIQLSEMHGAGMVKVNKNDSWTTHVFEYWKQ